MNGVVEAANKNLKKIIQKMVVTYKDLHECSRTHFMRTAPLSKLPQIQPRNIWYMG